MVAQAYCLGFKRDHRKEKDKKSWLFPTGQILMIEVSQGQASR